MSLFIEKGYQEADINLGCPFPMLARRHNGCGMLPYPEEVKALLSEAIDRHPDIRFSVKLRLGWEQAEVSCPATAVQRTPSHTSSCTRVWASSNTKER